MKKLFKDSLSKSIEPARSIGFWGNDNSIKAFESTSIYMSHLVRLENGKTVSYIYDPGKVLRYLKSSLYKK